MHAWEAWGERCVERFRGMFAFALWDRNRETLFLARDRLGVKPLYYALLPDGQLLFGSEIKSLLKHPGLDRAIDPLAVEEYFAFGYVAEPRSIYRSVRKLPPAHTLVIRRGEPLGEPRRYWDVRFTADSRISLEDARERAQPPARGLGATPADLRGAAGRVPLGRRRFERRGGDDGAGVAGAA